MLVITPGGLRLGSVHEAGAFLGGTFGAFLMPWALAGLVVYGHWLWWKSRAKAEAMQSLYPDRKRLWLNATVIVLTTMMATEALWIVLSQSGA